LKSEDILIRREGNKTRKGNKIGKEEWRKHFMSLLDNTEIRVRRKRRKK